MWDIVVFPDFSHVHPPVFHNHVWDMWITQHLKRCGKMWDKWGFTHIHHGCGKVWDKKVIHIIHIQQKHGFRALGSQFVIMWDIGSYPHFVDNFAMISSTYPHNIGVRRHTKADYNRGGGRGDNDTCTAHC
jgi:hypothetical protein